MENQITIKPSFDSKSIFWASLAMGANYRIIIYFIIILVFAAFKFSQVGLSSYTDLIPFVIVFPLVLGALLFGIYKKSKQQITDNPKIKEDITYIVTNDYFYEKGESFEIKYFWKDVFKVAEKKDFFLIYIKKNVAKIIKKSDLKDNQYNELKALLNSLQIKKSLK